MNTKYATLLLSTACAIGLSGAALAQDATSTTSNTAAATPMQTGGMQSLVEDQATNVSGVQVMCGGIGSDESDPKYAGYPAKIEVAGGYGQWVGNNDITVAGEGLNIAAHCRGPWFMAQLQPGRYRVTAAHGTLSHTASLSVAANGQHKIVVRFPELQRGKDDGQGPYTGQQMNNGQTPDSSM